MEKGYRDADRKDTFQDLTRRGVGGSAAVTPSTVSVTGRVTSTLADNLKIVDSKGGELKLDTNPSTRVLRDGVPVRCPALWDGKAAARIAEVIVAGGGPLTHARPTDLVL